MERKKSAGAELLKLETDLDVVRSVRDFLDQKAGFHLLPENLGLADVALNNGIGKYNEMILRRNKLLQTARESNPLIKGIESQLRGLKENIRMAIENVEKGLEIKIQSLEKENQLVDKKLTSVPTQEKQVPGDLPATGVEGESFPVPDAKAGGSGDRQIDVRTHGENHRRPEHARESRITEKIHDSVDRVGVGSCIAFRGNISIGSVGLQGAGYRRCREGRERSCIGKYA